MIKIVAKCELKENCKEDFINTAKGLIIESRKEEGNISYGLYEDMLNPNIVTFIEEWKDIEAIDFHRTTDHYKQYGRKLSELRVGETDVTLYKEIE